MTNQTTRRMPEWHVCFLRGIESSARANDEDGTFITEGQAKALREEIERLRARLAKIANAPVPSDHPIALMLKAWAMPREGEYPYA